MAEEAQPLPPVLAQVLSHPTTGQIMIVLNEAIPENERGGFCLGAAQTFIGLAARHFKDRKPKIAVAPPGMRIQ